MTDPFQLLLYLVVVVLTIVLVLIGWQIIRILSEVRKMLVKMNSTMDNVADFTGSIGRNISGFSDGMRTVFSLINIFKKKEKKEDQYE